MTDMGGNSGYCGFCGGRCELRRSAGLEIGPQEYPLDELLSRLSNKQGSSPIRSRTSLQSRFHYKTGELHSKARSPVS